MTRPPDTVLVAITCAGDFLAIMAFVTAEYNPEHATLPGEAPPTDPFLEAAQREVEEIAPSFAHDAQMGDRIEPTFGHHIISPPSNVRWSRLATAEAVELEIARNAMAWDAEKLTRPPTDIERTKGRFDVRDLPIKGWRFIDRADIPTDRTYRNALRDDGKKLAHDMPHARELHKMLIRSVRARKLADLDVEYQRADEQGSPRIKETVAERKQALRDLTADPAIDQAQTTDDLKKTWPFPDDAIPV